MNKDDKLEMKLFNEEEKKNCFFCKKNIPGQVTFLIFILIVAVSFYIYFVKINFLNENGFEYSISKKIFTKKNEFIFKIKNNSNQIKNINYKDIVFIIIDEKNLAVYYQNITLEKNELEPKKEIEEIISVNSKFKFGNYKAEIFLDPNSIKKVEIRFSVR